MHGTSLTTMRRATLSLALALVALGGTLTTLLASPGRAAASTNQISIIQDGGVLAPTAGSTLQQMRALGATTVRVLVYWYGMAPSPNATKVPKGFNGANPNDYSAAAWQPYDQLVTLAKQYGMTVDFDLAVGAPRWAEGSGIPSNYLKDHYFAWKPNAKLYGQFVKAFGTRYSGTFTPKGGSAALPRVSFWGLWNEPNFGQDLGPQATDGSRIYTAPAMYRSLVSAGWSALSQTKHSKDTILIGEVAADGRNFSIPRSHANGAGLPGNSAISKTIPFIQTLYCVGANYRPLSGSAAATVGCPTTSAGISKFRAQNPGLFNATGFADHPYLSTNSPVNTNGLGSEDTAFPVINNLPRALDRVVGAYGSGKKYPIYSDEYGYITSPPYKSGHGYPSPATAAIYLNWAEYISYKNPRIASYAQYLLKDGPPSPTNILGGFTSGLEFANGKAKATLAAYRLPVYLPSTTLAPGRSYEIWGGARPAGFAFKDSKAPQKIAIQFQAGGKGAWKTLKTVTVSKTTGYFDIHTSLPSSGKLRTSYTYPATSLFVPPGTAGSTVTSRVVAVKVS